MSTTDAEAIPAHRPRNRPVVRGFTLVESLIACVVLAMSILAIGTAVNFAYASTARVDAEETAVALARQMMEQLASLPFRDVSIERDSVVEYDGYSDSFLPGGTSRSGAVVVVGSGRRYERSVLVSYREPPAAAAVNAAATDLAVSAAPSGLAVVKVRVTTADGRVAELSQLFADVATE